MRFGRRQDPSEPGRYAIWINTEPIGYPGGWREITPDNLTVERLDFYITPDDDPFTWQDAPLGYPYDQQPIVTIVLETKSLLGDESTEQHISRFQTTVTPRSYQR